MLSLFLQQSPKYLFTDDKIYTVLTVILIIWTGIILYLLRMEKKIKKIESQMEDTDHAQK